MHSELHGAFGNDFRDGCQKVIGVGGERRGMGGGGGIRFREFRIVPLQVRIGLSYILHRLTTHENNDLIIKISS